MHFNAPLTRSEDSRQAGAKCASAYLYGIQGVFPAFILSPRFPPVAWKMLIHFQLHIIQVFKRSGMDQKIAVVFPGQGSQRHGMGRDFYEQVEESRRVYEEASECLGWDVAGLCFSEHDERLDLTEYAQPCILTTEIAIL